MVYFEREAKVSFAGFFGAELIMLCVISDVMVGRLVIWLSYCFALDTSEFGLHSLSMCLRKLQSLDSTNILNGKRPSSPRTRSLVVNLFTPIILLRN